MPVQIISRPALPAIVLMLLCVTCTTFTSATAYASPRIVNLSPRGLQSGATTTLVIDGRELLPNPRVFVPAPIAKQVVKQGATAARIEIEITLSDDVLPGVYPLRVCSDRGVSSPQLVAVDSLPGGQFAAEISALPVSLDGRLAGNQILSTTFEGAKQQRIVLDVQARRLGSSLDPVIRLYDPRGAQIAWSPPRSIVAGDARCETVLPVDGRYTIELHDRNYRAAGGAYFRLNAGDLHYADLPFPLGVTAGKMEPLEFVSAQLPADFAHRLTAPAGANWLTAGIAGVKRFSGPQPTVVVSRFPELVEAPAGDGGAQTLSAAPFAVSGRISAKGEEDLYSLPVRGGAKLRIDVLADRLGSALDGVLTVRRKNGQQLAQGDDRAGSSDPAVEVTVPNNEDTLLLALRDLRGEGGEEFVYRIAVEEAGPDYALALEDDAVNIPAGGSQLLIVRAERRNLNVPIELAFDGLPTGVEAAGNWIDAGDSIGLVTLTATSREASYGTVRITGMARAGESERVITRPALLPESEVSRRQAWLREELAVAVARVAPIRIAWGDDDVDETLWLGSNRSIAVNVDRSTNAAGKVRLRLVTTQEMPKKTVKQGNQDVTVDDVDRALRLAENIELAPDAEADVAARLAVPNDLAAKTWATAVVAELLSPDGKTVVATAATPVRRFSAKRAVKLALTSADKINAVAGQGETGTLKGTLERTAGIDGPVTVTLAGLAEQYPSPKLEVPAGQNEFSLEVRFPAGAPPADLKDVRLIASTLTNPDDPMSAAQSNEVPVSIKVVAGN